MGIRGVNKGNLALLAGLLTAIWGSSMVRADGTETLGPPSVAIAPGSGIVIAGAGLAEADVANLEIDVPGEVRQALLYWEGQSVAPFPTDDTIVVNGIEVQGTLIGGPTLFSTNRYSTQTYRTDITALGLVNAGPNVLEVGGLAFNFNNDGAGLLVIYDDGSGDRHLDIRDGSDFAFINFPGVLKHTVPVTHTFEAAGADRTAYLSLFVASVDDDRSNPQPERPTSIAVTMGGVTTLHSNLLSSASGLFWDSLVLPIDIPAGVDALTVQVFSRDDLGTGFLPASLSWVTSALSLAPPQACGNGVVEPGEACDDGNLDDGDGCSALCEVEEPDCEYEVFCEAEPLDGPNHAHQGNCHQHAGYSGHCQGHHGNGHHGGSHHGNGHQGNGHHGHGHQGNGHHGNGHQGNGHQTMAITTRTIMETIRATGITVDTTVTITAGIRAAGTTPTGMTTARSTRSLSGPPATVPRLRV